MKNSKFLSKKTVTLAAMVLALGAAVWLNVKYSDVSNSNIATGSNTKYLGEALYVNGNASGEKAKNDDYFTSTVSEREKTRKDAIALLEESIADAKLTDAQKQSAVSELASISADKNAESAIESLIKAKGFEKVVAVIGEDSVSVVVKSDHDLLDSETMQITDAVTSQVKVDLEKIKIITLK